MIYEALHKMAKAGFAVRECQGLLDVSPDDRLSDVQRSWVEKHKAAIVRQLQGLRDHQVAALIETFQAEVIRIVEQKTCP